MCVGHQVDADAVTDRTHVRRLKSNFKIHSKGAFINDVTPSFSHYHKIVILLRTWAYNASCYETILSGQVRYTRRCCKCSLFYRMHVLYHYHQLFIVIDCVSFKENIIYVSFVFDPEINPHSLIVCCFISPTRLVIESMVICVTH